MKALGAIRYVAGSAFVYVLVVACGAASDELQARAHNDAGEVADDPEKEGGSGGSFLDAIADALTDPVADADAEQPISGTRLKAEYLRGADGSRHFLRWWDTARNEGCAHDFDAAMK